MTEERKKLLRPFDWFVLIGALALLAYILLQNNDIQLLERSESVEIYRPGERERPSERRRGAVDRQREVEVDRALQRLAEQLSTGYSPPKGQSVEGLTNGEQDYLSSVEERYSEAASSMRNVGEWLRVLRGSYRTYDRVRSVFSELSGEDSGELEAHALDQLMSESSTREQALDRLKDVFDVSEEDMRAFARLGKQQLNEWVEFLEQYDRR